MNRYSDIDRTLDMMDELRRRMDWAFGGPDNARREGAWRAFFEDNDRPSSLRGTSFPRINLFDTGSGLYLQAEVPGLSEKDVQLTVHNDVLTLSGARKSDAPEGYMTHRQERAPVQFSRSFSLPCKVDLEKTTATIKNGILTVTMAKAPEAQPRQIQVQAR